MHTYTDNIPLFPSDIQGKHLHFTGIKGTGMAALAEICTYRGARITGSDVAEHFYTDDVLAALDILPQLFDTSNITADIDLLIYSAAYKLDSHPELLAAKELNIPIILYTEALGAISASSYSCGIAGVHGKTSTTGIAGTLVKSLNLPVQVLAGSIIPSFGLSDNSCTLNLGKEFFIAETCEYKRHFMSFHPQKIILTSVESDHQDYFPDYKSIRDAFVDYGLLLPQNGELIYCADDKGACETANIIKAQRSDIILVPYGTKATGDYHVIFGDIINGKQHFNLDLFEKDFPSGFYLQIPGKHNVLNAAAACAMVISLWKKTQTSEQKSIDKKTQLFSKLKNGLISFAGSRRRCEIIGHVKKTYNNGDTGIDLLIIDDYGHHPTAVKTTLEGLRSFYPDHYLITDFMPHTYSRTVSLLDDFALSFAATDEVILHKIYASAREIYDGTINGYSLFEKTKEHHSFVHYFEEVQDALPYLCERVKEINKKVLFITMGAGDNWKLGKLLFENITKD